MAGELDVTQRSAVMAPVLLRSHSYIQDSILKQGVGCSTICFVAAADLHAAVTDSRMPH